MRVDDDADDRGESHQCGHGRRATSRRYPANWGDRKRQELEGIIRAYVRVDIDDETAEIWAGLRADCARLGRNVGLNDLWIAASGVRLDAPVAALDDDFGRIPGIRFLGSDGSIVETT